MTCPPDRVILNEHKYFEYWLEHPELEEVAINADAMKLLVTKIYDLDLPTRIMNCFRVLDINYMFELVDKKPKDFLVYRNMGEKSMKQLTDYVESLGFCFDYKIRFSEKDKLYYTLK
jgi:DNA-directed RNA polymerase alpha subunit